MCFRLLAKLREEFHFRIFEKLRPMNHDTGVCTVVQSVRSSGKSRESSFEPVRRLIFLHNLLKRSTAGRRLTAQRATEQMNASGFEVSLRTVQRYLEQCEQHFSGVRRDDCKPAGWWWGQPQ